MKSSVLSPDAVLRLKELYDERDSRGRRVHSHMSLGELFGVSETTVLRALKNIGAFAGAPTPLKDSPELQAKIALSASKLLAQLKEEQENGPTKPKSAADPNRRIDPADGKTEYLDTISGKWIKLPY